jgi:hypothetical protein
MQQLRAVNVNLYAAAFSISMATAQKKSLQHPML